MVLLEKTKSLYDYSIISDPISVCHTLHFFLPCQILLRFKANSLVKTRETYVRTEYDLQEIPLLNSLYAKWEILKMLMSKFLLNNGRIVSL